MRLDEIVTGEVKRNSRLEIHFLFREGHRQMCEPLDVQAGRGIQPFNVARGDEIELGASVNGLLFNGADLWGAIPALSVDRFLGPIGLDNLAVVNAFAAKCPVDSIDIGF